MNFSFRLSVGRLGLPRAGRSSASTELPASRQPAHRTTCWNRQDDVRCTRRRLNLRRLPVEQARCGQNVLSRSSSRNVLTLQPCQLRAQSSCPIQRCLEVHRLSLFRFAAASLMNLSTQLACFSGGHSQNPSGQLVPLDVLLFPAGSTRGTVPLPGRRRSPEGRCIRSSASGVPGIATCLAKVFEITSSGFNVPSCGGCTKQLANARLRAYGLKRCEPCQCHVPHAFQ